MLRSVIGFLKLIRWFHELLGLFPFIALFLIINYNLKQSGISCNLSIGNFIILCVGVQLLMISGFILNDIVDRDIDKINKPNTRVIERLISPKSAKLLFIISSILIIPISLYIGIFLFSEWFLISIITYLAAVAYSLYLKRSPLLGNIAIAAMASFIPLVIMFFAKDCLHLLNSERLNLLIYIYAGLPFLIIIPRELSLDISDIEGDKICGAKTLPIVIGIQKARLVVIALLILVIGISIPFILKYTFLASTFLFIDAMLVLYIILFIRTHNRLRYIQIGRFLWAIMICGIIGSTIACM